MSENPFNWLQRFYQSLCNRKWEGDHNYACMIDNTTDPGWRFRFNLIGTSYEDMELGELRDESGPIDWLNCKMHDGLYVAMCSPRRLAQCIEILRDVVEGRRGIRRASDASAEETEPRVE